MMDEEVFLGVMDLQEAKTHQIKLKSLGLPVELKVNGETCTTGCKVTVEMWGLKTDELKLQEYFHFDFKKNLGHHAVNLEALGSVYDPSLESVLCQACGASFSPSANECPDCGLVY